MRTADLRAFVPIEPEPAQRLEDERLGAGDVALLVGVLDAQDERAARVTRRQPREEGGAYGAEVQRPGGGGREARPNLRRRRRALVRREEYERQDRPGEQPDDEHRRVEVRDHDAHHAR